MLTDSFKLLRRAALLSIRACESLLLFDSGFTTRWNRAGIWGSGYRRFEYIKRSMLRLHAQKNALIGRKKRLRAPICISSATTAPL